MVSKIVTYIGAALVLVASAFGGMKLIQHEEKFNPEYWQEKVSVAINRRQAYLDGLEKLAAESKNNVSAWNNSEVVFNGLEKATSTFKDFDHLEPVSFPDSYREPREFEYDMTVHNTDVFDSITPKGPIISYLNRTFPSSTTSTEYSSRFFDKSDLNGEKDMGTRLQILVAEVKAKYSDTAAENEAIAYAASATAVTDAIIGCGLGMAIVGIPLAFLINLLGGKKDSKTRRRAIDSV